MGLAMKHSNHLDQVSPLQKSNGYWLLFIAILLLVFLHILGHLAVSCRSDFLIYMPLLTFTPLDASRAKPERMKSLPIEIVTNHRDALYAPPNLKPQSSMTRS
jgi:hypothetical protein